MLDMRDNHGVLVWGIEQGWTEGWERGLTIAANINQSSRPLLLTLKMRT